MATVTGYTAERMKAIEDKTVTDGEVTGDNLILTTRDGTPIDAGNVRGPQGVKGDTGEVTQAEMDAAITDAVQPSSNPGNSLILGSDGNIFYDAAAARNATITYAWCGIPDGPVASNATWLGQICMTIPNAKAGWWEITAYAKMAFAKNGYLSIYVLPEPVSTFGASIAAMNDGLKNLTLPLVRMYEHLAVGNMTIGVGYGYGGGGGADVDLMGGQMVAKWIGSVGPVAVTAAREPLTQPEEQ